MITSLEKKILDNVRLNGLDDEQIYRVDRVRALLKDSYYNYRWLENRINRGENKKGKKFEGRVEKLKRRQGVISERIDELENAYEKLSSK